MTERTFTVRTDITNFCNIRCDMCHFSEGMPARIQRLTPSEFKRRFSSLGPEIRTLYLSCACEPLCTTPDTLSEIARHARKELGIPDLRIITNAVTLNERFCTCLIETGFSEIHVSIDSPVKETFERIREGAHFERVVDNLKRLRDMKTERRVTRPLVKLNVVIMRSNIEQLTDLTDLASELGCEKIALFHLVPKKPEHFDESLYYHQELTNESLAAFRQACARHSIAITRMPADFDLKPEPPDAEPARRNGLRCRFIENNDIFVVDNGDVRPCGFWYDERPFGNLDTESFQEVWTRGEYARFRNEMAKGVLTRACCRKCPSMGSGDVNDPRGYEAH